MDVRGPWRVLPTWPCSRAGNWIGGRRARARREGAGGHRLPIKDAEDSFSEIGLHLAQAALKLVA